MAAAVGTLIMHKQSRPAKTAAPLVACTDTQNKVRVVCDVLWVVVGRMGGWGGVAYLACNKATEVCCRKYSYSGLRALMAQGRILAKLSHYRNSGPEQHEISLVVSQLLLNPKTVETLCR